MGEWVSKETLIWVSTFSGVGLVAAAIVIPWLIVRMPEDFFSHPQRYNWLGRKPASVRIPIRILKNLLAIALVIVGIVMFLTPASGLFPILLGVVLADVPGKLKLQRWILCRKTVRKSMNWLRGKFHRRPVQMPSEKQAA
ncbi:MAG TPA: hypothetical protein VL261_10615 [Nitrospira sp.]|jgi:hypothetical protein|nr:hypothetical protein [Nitrospira sp.]